MSYDRIGKVQYISKENSEGEQYYYVRYLNIGKYAPTALGVRQNRQNIGSCYLRGGDMEDEKRDKGTFERKRKN